MKTLGEPTVLNEVLSRVAALRTDSVRAWGRMIPGQAICHLDDSYLVCVGEKPVKDVSNPFSRSVMKYVALNVPMKWPKGVPTGPEIEQGKGGTPPAQFESDRQRLLKNLERFATMDLSNAHHPMFGAMSHQDWMRWAYLHADHHLRQFGC